MLHLTHAMHQIRISGVCGPGSRVTENHGFLAFDNIIFLENWAVALASIPS
jgi:hypothetical protein